MKKVQVKTLNDLEDLFSKYNQGFLFRGQTKHYLDSNHNINISTSFSRHGCIPSSMLKWTHYSQIILNVFLGYPYHEISSELSQTILQHYGWRSFYVDLTKSPAIACWFAANQYKEAPSFHMAENFDENPILLVHRQAQYIPTNNDGHIYIIDTKILEEHGIHIYDLTKLKSKETKLRFHAQQACLAGICNKLPEQAIVLHAEVKSEILMNYYIRRNILELNDVFPHRNQDFILNALLELPWKNISVDDPIPLYTRTLELPEYDIEFFKFSPANVALFNHYWIANDREEEDHPLHGIIFYKLPEVSYYCASGETYSEFSEVNALLNKYRRIALELDGLIKSPHANNYYEKGILIEKNTDNTVSISALIIKHPGNLVAGIGITLGWYYKIKNELWSRIEHPAQCKCNNSLNHELQFALLRIFNEYLKTHKIFQQDALNYIHQDIFIALQNK